MGEDDFRFNMSEKEGYTSVNKDRMILISLGEPRFKDAKIVNNDLRGALHNAILSMFVT